MANVNECGVSPGTRIITKDAVDRLTKEWGVDYGETKQFHYDHRFLMKPEAYQELKVVWVNVSHGSQVGSAFRKDKVEAVDTRMPFQYVIGLYDTNRERAMQVHSNGVFRHMNEALEAIQNRIDQGFYWEKMI